MTTTTLLHRYFIKNNQKDTFLSKFSQTVKESDHSSSDTLKLKHVVSNVFLIRLTEIQGCGVQLIKKRKRICARGGGCLQVDCKSQCASKCEIDQKRPRGARINITK